MGVDMDALGKQKTSRIYRNGIKYLSIPRRMGGWNNT